MIAATERGLLLTCLWYIREVDPQTLLLTGLTRDGVYLVENGEVSARSTTSGSTSRRSTCSAARPRSDPSAHVAGVERLLHPHGDAALRVPDFNMSTVSKAS